MSEEYTQIGKWYIFQSKQRIKLSHVCPFNAAYTPGSYKALKDIPFQEPNCRRCKTAVPEEVTFFIHSLMIDDEDLSYTIGDGIRYWLS